MGSALFRDRARLPVFHVSAVGAGLSVALGIHIVATAFGLGVAFSWSDTFEEGVAAFGLLLWSGLAWIAASFVGGYITVRVSNLSGGAEGLFHGLVFWGALTSVILFLPPSTMGIGAGESETLLPANVISSVAWFIAIGGLLSLGTTIWGAVIGSGVVEKVEANAADTTYRAA